MINQFCASDLFLYPLKTSIKLFLCLTHFVPDVFRGGIERDQCYEMIKSKLISQALKQMLNLSMCYVIVLTFFYYIHLSCIDMCISIN